MHISHIHIYSVFPFSYCLLAAQFPHLEQYSKNNATNEQMITERDRFIKG